MSDILYSKLRLEVPSALNGQNATITSERGNSRVVQMTSPITDIMLAGMEKYRVQAGFTDEDVSFGYGQIKKVEAMFRHFLKRIPTTFNSWGVNMGSAVVYNNEIHIFRATNHYKFNGTDWVAVSTVPYDCTYGVAVVYNNEIHVMGGTYDSNSSLNMSRKHYAWNGSSWRNVSNLPYIFSGGSGHTGSAVVLNGELHILGAYGASSEAFKKYHYKWNGTAWSSVSTLPTDLSYNSAFIRDGYLEYIQGTSHYRWNGSSWYSVSTAPYPYSDGAIVILDNEIHMLGGGSTYDAYKKRHYLYSNNTWTILGNLPFDFRYGGLGLAWNSGMSIEEIDSNEIVLLSPWDDKLAVAQWDGTSWTIGED